LHEVHAPAKAPQIRIIGATVTTALRSSNAAHGFPEQDQKRRALNDIIRMSGLFGPGGFINTRRISEVAFTMAHWCSNARAISAF
jgi:hypothetical protein